MWVHVRHDQARFVSSPRVRPSRYRRPRSCRFLSAITRLPGPLELRRCAPIGLTLVAGSDIGERQVRSSTTLGCRTSAGVSYT